MARGRMINSRICMDKRISELSSDTSRLAFTWLITFGDREGRTYGDPTVVRSMLFPRRDDITAETVAGFLAEWAALGLIQWYEADGDRWVAFPAFQRNQTGLDRRKEPQSLIPEYVPGTEAVRTEYVPGTAEKKRTEKKRTEENRAVSRNNGLSADALPVTTAATFEEKWKRPVDIGTPLGIYQENFRFANPQQQKDLADMEAECGAEVVIEAVRWAARKGMGDTDKIWSAARRMKREGLGPKPEFDPLAHMFDFTEDRLRDEAAKRAKAAQAHG